MIPLVPIPPPPSELRRYEASTVRSSDSHTPVNIRYPSNEQAQEIVFDASDDSSDDPMNRFFACERALQVFPFSVEAFNLLGDTYRKQWNHLGRAMVAYSHANKCGKLLWPHLENQQTISWKDQWEYRPFLESYKGLGVTALNKGGDLERSEKFFNLLLKWNPTDEQGIIPLLFLLLIERGAHKAEQIGAYKSALEVAKKSSPGEEYKSKCWYRYGIYLTKFLRNSTSQEQKLASALRSNNFVAMLLAEDNDNLPDYTGELSSMGLDEAIDYVRDARSTWKRLRGNPVQRLKDLRFRGGLKPQDGGKVLFDLMERGCVIISTKYDSEEIKHMEVTTNLKLPVVKGKEMPSFRVPKGMKEFDPLHLLICYVTGAGAGLDSFQTRNVFFRLAYRDVQEIPFWNVLMMPEGRCPLFVPCYAEGCKNTLTSCCSRCSVAAYCSNECQVRDWAFHKKMCNKYRKT